MPYAKRLEQAAIPHPEHRRCSAALGDPRGPGAVVDRIVMPRLSDSMEEGTILTLAEVRRATRSRSARSWSRSRPTRRTWPTRRAGAGTLVEVLAQEGDTLPIGSGDRAAGRGRARSLPNRLPCPSGRWRERRTRSPAPPRRPSPSVPAAGESALLAAAEPALASSPSGEWKSQGVAAGPARSPGRTGSSSRRSGRFGARGTDRQGRRRTGDRRRSGSDGSRSDSGRDAVSCARRGDPGARERPETAQGRAVTQEELTKLQQTVARRMAESKATAPHFYLVRRRWT